MPQNININLNLKDFLDAKESEKEKAEDAEKEVKVEDEKEKEEDKKVEDAKGKEETKEPKGDKEEKEEKTEIKDSVEKKEVESMNFKDVMDKLNEINALPNTEFKDKALEDLNAKAIEAGLGSILPKEEVKADNPFEDSVAVNNLGVPMEEKVEPNINAIAEGLNKFFDSIDRNRLDRNFKTTEEQKSEIYKASSIRAKDIVNGVDL